MLYQELIGILEGEKILVEIICLEFLKVHNLKEIVRCKNFKSS